VDYLESVGEVEEAAQQLAICVNDDAFVSKKGVCVWGGACNAYIHTCMADGRVCGLCCWGNGGASVFPIASVHAPAFHASVSSPPPPRPLCTGTSKHALWMRLCDMCAKHPQAVSKRLKVSHGGCWGVKGYRAVHVEAGAVWVDGGTGKPIWRQGCWGVKGTGKFTWRQGLFGGTGDRGWLQVWSG
jgi:hypothetical protein